jgi:hypothetical protein
MRYKDNTIVGIYKIFPEFFFRFGGIKDMINDYTRKHFEIHNLLHNQKNIGWMVYEMNWFEVPTY